MFEPHRVKIRRGRMCKCVTCNACTHSQIGAKMPNVGIEPEALAHVAQSITQLSKWADEYRAPPFLQNRKRTDGRSGGPGGNGELEMGTFENENENGELKRDPFSHPHFHFTILPFSKVPHFHSAFPLPHYPPGPPGRAAVLFRFCKNGGGPSFFWLPSRPVVLF